MIRFSVTMRLLGVLAVSLFFATGFALAKEAPAGSVVAARGHVEATGGDGIVRPLKIKADVFSQDTVRTGKDGRVQLLFRDNTIISLGVGAVMKIADYQWDAEKKNGVMKTRVEEGTFRVLGGLITKSSPKSFATETPAATIGIRGSMYAGKASRDETVAVFLGGKGIVVFNPAGEVEITQPGYGVRVRIGQPPGMPVPFSEEELSQLIDSLADDTTGAPEPGGEGFQVSDFTTDFDKATEDGLPFDPNGFSPPTGDVTRDTTTDFGQGVLTPEPSTPHYLPPYPYAY